MRPQLHHHPLQTAPTRELRTIKTYSLDDFFSFLFIFYFVKKIKKREKPLDSDVKTQQEQKNNKKKQLSKYNKDKSSHSPGPTTFSPAKSLA